ncbi:scavenger receptor class B member 1-like isoform X1 [Colias croceus]|uniref:scavenger receptor class B member 1-like isoform X1 n=2 Tax=Colias crocea TaxID=72248 RepID=UPI001E27FE4A|nr:scavenger receptor class B member 1-like isoform X1 [Colias croceus]
MKELVQIWSRVTGRRYSSVNTGERELRDFGNNRLKNIDLDAVNFDANLSECEGLNKFNDELDFNERKEAIINRLFERRKKGHVTRQPKRLFILLMLGFFCLGTGLFIAFVHPYDILFRWKILFQDGGEIFEMWRKPEVELYVKVYLFNVTNAEEYMAGIDKTIKVKEVGPFVYREFLEHNVTRFNENGTLSAIPKHPLTWVGELSEGNSEDDVLYLPHIALLSIANVVSQQSFVTRFGLNNLISLTNSQPLAKMTAREFMMGYKSELMTLGNTFMPGWIYFDKLGLIDRMYDFNGDFETIFTGETDITQSGLIDTYRGSTDLPQWSGKHCSNVQYASDGTKFKTALSRNESVLFYRKSLCRAAPLIPVKDGVKNGLKGLMYTFPEHMLDNGKYHEENKCFCRFGKCLPEGLIDVTDCYYGFPIALSYPHFYKGDEVLFNKIEGLSPDKELHETRFWIQPDSGLPLDVSTKFQINMALGDITSIKNSEKFANMYLPLLWFDIRMHNLPPSMEMRFKMYLNILPVVERVIMYLTFISGAILIFVTIYILTFKIMFKSYKKNWSDEKRNMKDIYAPCEIPLNDTESDSPDSKYEIRPFKSHSDRIKELSQKLSDKVYDTVRIFEDRKNSLIVPEVSTETNDAFRSESDSDMREKESDDDCKYLEIIDDGSGFDDYVYLESDKLRELDK